MVQLLSIYEVLTIVIGQKAHANFVAALYMNYVVPVREAITRRSLGYLLLKDANPQFVDVSDQAPH